MSFFISCIDYCIFCKSCALRTERGVESGQESQRGSSDGMNCLGGSRINLAKPDTSRNKVCCGYCQIQSNLNLQVPQLMSVLITSNKIFQ